MSLHVQKRLNQNHSRCDAADCPQPPDGQRVTIATGERGGAGDYAALYACSWGCALVVVSQGYNAALLAALDEVAP